ncbi:translocator protein-like [Ostrinia nubilalis]|uniref:translocator protein-like n=1 Tax=Ostrinia nubilalis TaxID=29057 RepID=UPI0030825A88
MVNWTMVAGMIIPNVGGWLGTLTMIGQVKSPDGKAWYQLIHKPSWNPPNWVFGPAWTTLYTGMGFASYLVFQNCGGFTERAMIPLSLYGGQLILNWLWTPVFFGLHQIQLAFFHMLALDAAAAVCTASFMQVNRTAGYLMLPYLAWLGFATCLNYSIWQLNKDGVTDEVKDR